MSAAPFLGFSCGTTDRCPHSTRSDASPDRCSLCLGAAVRRIATVDHTITIDGVPARPIDAETTAASRYYGKRGKAQSMRVTRKT